METTSLSKYSDSQIQLQSLAASDLIPKSEYEFVAGLASIEYADTYVGHWADKILKGVLDGNPPRYTFHSFFSVMSAGQSLHFNLNTGTIRFDIQSNNSDSPGAIGMVGIGNGYLGRINPDSTLYLLPTGQNIRRQIVDLSMYINRDPEAAIRLQGRSTGTCPFCRQTLPSPADINTGYDLICASRHNFFHPDQAQAAKSQMNSIINLVKKPVDHVVFPADSMQNILSEFEGKPF
jgi:hypothetical protein